MPPEYETEGKNHVKYSTSAIVHLKTPFIFPWKLIEIVLFKFL